MRKLLVFALFVLLFSKVTTAQEKSPVTSLSILAAPNSALQLRGKIIGGSSYIPKTGYTVGLEFARSINNRWRVKLGLRYNVWNTIVKSGILFWPSEFSTGVYVFDPTLPHSIETRHADKVWQYLAGASWQSKPGKWRFVAEAEVGFTDYPTGANKSFHPTTGLSFGVEWAMTHHFQLFMQPGSRFIFRELGANDNPGYSIISVQLETGVRYSFR